MTKRMVPSLIRDDGGAIAATYALAMVALVVMAGVGFDYARLVSVDTELQNAADEAALAAATQLDQKSDSITRAQSAVTDYFANSSSPVVNRTLLANDGNGSAITGVTFDFFVSYTNDTFGASTTTGTTAQVVEVTITARRAFYALTPIVGAFNSGDITAKAVAGLQSGICKTPPMMVCAPNADFPTSSDVGVGILLQPGSAGSWAPGTFGYLDFGQGANTVKDLLASNDGIDECASGSSVTAQQGNIASAPDYLNTRFDIYTNPLTPAGCLADGTLCPASSTRKDLVRMEQYTYKNQDTVPARPACNAAATNQNLGGGNKVDVTEWVQVPSTILPATNALEGFPRDSCHNNGSSNSTGTCQRGNFGDGVWNVAGYRSSHPNVPTSLTTRYQIYKWERDNPASGLQSALVNSGDTAAVTGCNAAGRNCDVVWTNYCSYPSAIKGTYHATPKDRRVFTVAVVDCANPTGGPHTFKVNRWMDVFLTEPSWDRNVPYTRSSQIYGEVIGPATDPAGNTAFQYYGRQKAVLLR